MAGGNAGGQEDRRSERRRLDCLRLKADCPLELGGTNRPLAPLATVILPLFLGKPADHPLTTAFLPLFPSKPAARPLTTAFLPLFLGKLAFLSPTTVFLPLFLGKPAFLSPTTVFLPLFPGKLTIRPLTTAFLPLFPTQIRRPAPNNGISAVVSSLPAAQPHWAIRLGLQFTS
ncbi:hypothetical protein [Paenibacillus sp. BAC0078]